MKYCKDCELMECCMRTPLGGCNLDVDNTSPFIPRRDVPQSLFDWQSFRVEAAKMAMAGILAAGDSWEAQLIESRSNGKCAFPGEIAQFAIACADELIKQLKEEK